jgi:heme/copper-type cytochrome/quinol oxidase subunit 2
MTLVAILCSITSMAPGLGIVLAMLTVPALVRTCVISARRGARGEPTSIGEKTTVFLLTLATIIIVMVVAIAVFFVTLLAICATTAGAGRPVDGGGIFLALTLGGIAGVTVAILLTWLFWKFSHRRRSR